MRSGRAYELPERILAYGSGKFKALGAKVNGWRRRALVARREQSPELREAYEAKLADIEAFSTETQDPARVEGVERRYEGALDTLDRHLSDRSYICGAAYTLADVVWTVTVARQLMLGRDPLGQRPALTAWYGRMKARPSFAHAKIWESFHLSQMLPIVVGKLRAPLVAAAIVLTFVAGLVFVLAPDQARSERVLGNFDKTPGVSGVAKRNQQHRETLSGETKDRSTARAGEAKDRATARALRRGDGPSAGGAA